jgi:hypothetical protein
MQDMGFIYWLFSSLLQPGEHLVEIFGQSECGERESSTREKHLLEQAL